MPSPETQPRQAPAEATRVLNEFDQAYLTDPSFRSGVDIAWRRYQNKCAQANAGRDQTIGEALGELQQENARLMASHRAGRVQANEIKNLEANNAS